MQYSHGFGFMIWGQVIFFALTAWIVYWVVSSSRKGSREKEEELLGVLDKRLASGEISAREYRQIRDVLEGRSKERGKA